MAAPPVPAGTPWLGIASLGISILGGLFGGRAARRRARRVRKAADKGIAKLKLQIPGVNTYFDNLEDMLQKDTDIHMERGVQDFTASALSFSQKGEKLVEGGKGLISGMVDSAIEGGKEGLAVEGQRTLSDILANMEKTQLTLEQTRTNELNSIDNAISMLEVQKASA